jgi:hypothetical protein
LPTLRSPKRRTFSTYSFKNRFWTSVMLFIKKCERKQQREVQTE